MNNALLIWKKVFPFATAVLVFVLVTYAYFNPLLEGKQMDQHDIKQHKGMSKEIVDYRERTGQEPLWTNSMFGGMPAWQISVNYTKNLVRQIRKVVTLGLPYPAGTVFMYFLGFYILLLVLGVDPWLSMAGALAFGFSSYFFIILGAGHSSKANAIGYMAPVLAGIILAFKGKYAPGGLLTAIALALQLEANHLQITYYLLLLVVILGIFQLIDAIRFKTMPNFLKSSGVLIVAALMAVLTHSTNLYATWEYGKESMRGKPVLSKNIEDQTKGLDRSYITHWSYGIGETWSLLIPNAKGGATAAIGSDHPALENTDRNFRQAIAQQNAYWGDQPGTSGPVYTGAIVMFLFALGLFFVKGKYRYILIGGTLLSILLSWGKNFMPFTDFFLDYIPGYNKFRAVSMTLVIADLTIPLLGFLGLFQLYRNPNLLKEKKKWFFAAYGLTGGIALLFYIAPSVFFSFFSIFELEQFNRLKQTNPADAGQIDLFIRNLEEVRMSIFKKDALRSFLYISASAVLVYLFGIGKLKQNWLTGALTLLLLADMVTINTRYLNSSNFIPKRKMEVPFQPSLANNEILSDKDDSFRVVDITVSTFNDASTSYFHHSIGGYHGAKLQRYQDMIDHYILQEINDLREVMRNNVSLSAIQQSLAQSQVLNMLNTRYVIFNPQSPPIRNVSAFGNAWRVNQWKWANSANDEIDALETADLQTTAIIHDEFRPLLEGLNPTTDSTAMIELTQYEPNRLVYSIESVEESLFIFSEIWYTAGWKAFVDGKETDLIRANYVLRALRVPAGTSTIEMRFEPKVWAVGQTVSLISSSLLILLLLLWLFGEYKKWKQQSQA